MVAVVADVKLWIYNQALMHLGARKLASLTENRESRRVLDNIWDSAFIDYVLEQGQWKFAMRTMALTFSPSTEPAFGFQYLFTKPDDLKRLCEMSADERFGDPLLEYRDVGPYWAANIDTLYLRYVSNDPSYGNNLVLWTATFLLYVSHELALRAAPRIKNETTVDALEMKKKKALADARSLDAMAEATKFLPKGRWTSARSRGSPRRYDRG